MTNVNFNSLIENTGIPTAVVVGVCAHGLAVVRALAKAGVPVIALEKNRFLPGYHTSYAKVVQVADINGYGLIEALKETAKFLSGMEKPILFLTNDNMVRTVGQHWADLENNYQISWSHSRSQIVKLLNKKFLQDHCKNLNLPYPEAWLLTKKEEINYFIEKDISFPLIVKPTQPLSEFKVRLIENSESLILLVDNYQNSLPFIIQKWIPGGDQSLFFTAFYLDHGRILATFEGRKLASWPPALGQTTIAESHRNAICFNLARKFFEPLQLSGPVSLEIKIDESGQPWIIEPTLGRTDYWLDCCVANNVNLPFVEYSSQCGKSIETPNQLENFIWFDTERSPFSYLYFASKLNKKRVVLWRPRFSYFDLSDLKPFLISIRILINNIGERTLKNLKLRWPIKDDK